jgi:hypothetical protein
VAKAAPAAPIVAINTLVFNVGIPFLWKTTALCRRWLQRCEPDYHGLNIPAWLCSWLRIAGAQADDERRCASPMGWMYWLLRLELALHIGFGLLAGRLVKAKVNPTTGWWSARQRRRR